MKLLQIMLQFNGSKVLVLAITHSHLHRHYMVQVKRDVQAIELSELPHVKDVPCFVVIINFYRSVFMRSTTLFTSSPPLIYAFSNA